MDIEEEFKNLISSTIEEMGNDIEGDLNEVAAYAKARAGYLASVATEPGFEEALKAERDNVLLKAGVAAVGQGDDFDERMAGLIEGALMIAAKALVAL